MNNTQLFLALGIPTLAILTGILVNTRQIDMISRHIDSQMTALRNELKAELLRVEGVLDARLSQVEQILKIR